MNSHLNLFKSYSKKDRENQLENDLTRAFAICLQENHLFFHEVLKSILGESESYSNLFGNYEGKSTIEIDIQKKVSSLGEFDKLFAVSLSEYEMDLRTFFDQSNDKEYDPICDLVITLPDAIIIFEVKPDKTDCTAQLYNQAFNAFEGSLEGENVFPVDLNWKKLMRSVIQTNNFEAAINKPSRFLSDFISLIQMHNFKWLPQNCLASISPFGNTKIISDRLETAISTSKYQSLKNRLGYQIDQRWADELIFRLNESSGDISVMIYPGNTKKQGWSIFKNNGVPKFKDELIIESKRYALSKKFHFKFSGQRYITGLTGYMKNFKKEMLTKENFLSYSGRKKRGESNWKEIEDFFDAHFEQEYDWKVKCKWDELLVSSGRSQFDLSMGYELGAIIPYEYLQKIDNDVDDMSRLKQFLESVKDEFENILSSS